ncbi:unnamed protein product [Schistocephalus solidus]|uniref:Cyclin-dependent kinase 12 n=1 Tax=Schistocephalus solidus TaxID=70667 RepID=A0A183TMF1_SCHSO|nr:unnamed protein product [Schistocephalus solidus]
MSKGPSRQKHSVSSSASRRYDQSLERVFNNHNTHSFSGACEHVSNSEKAGEQHRSQRERRHRHHCREHDSAARRHESSSGESLLDDHYHSAAIRKHQEVDSTLSSYLYKSPREPSKFSDSAYKTAHVNKISDRHSASVKSPRINRASPPSAHRNRSPITSISTARSDNRNSTKMAGDSPHNLLRVRPDNRKRSYQDSSSTAVAANIASMSNKKMHSFAVSNCRGYDHASSTLDHRTAFSKGHTSAKAAKTRASLSELHDEVPAATNDLATNSPAKCPTDNQLRQIPVPITSPFAYNDPLLLTQVFSKFQQPLPASPPSPSSSFDGSFFDESKIPRRK